METSAGVRFGWNKVIKQKILALARIFYTELYKISLQNIRSGKCMVIKINGNAANVPNVPGAFGASPVPKPKPKN